MTRVGLQRHRKKSTERLTSPNKFLSNPHPWSSSSLIRHYITLQFKLHGQITKSSMSLEFHGHTAAHRDLYHVKNWRSVQCTEAGIKALALIHNKFHTSSCLISSLYFFFLQILRIFPQQLRDCATVCIPFSSWHWPAVVGRWRACNSSRHSRSLQPDAGWWQRLPRPQTPASPTELRRLPV